MSPQPSWYQTVYTQYGGSAVGQWIANTQFQTPSIGQWIADGKSQWSTLKQWVGNQVQSAKASIQQAEQQAWYTFTGTIPSPPPDPNDPNAVMNQQFDDAVGGGLASQTPNALLPAPVGALVTAYSYGTKVNNALGTALDSAVVQDPTDSVSNQNTPDVTPSPSSAPSSLPLAPDDQLAEPNSDQ